MAKLCVCHLDIGVERSLFVEVSRSVYCKCR